MRECDNDAMRDRLPDLLQDARAGDASLAAVRAHVDVCDACGAELALLSAVRDAAAAPAVNVARIAGGIPPYQPAVRRWAPRPALRVAAAVLLVAGLGSVMTRGPGLPEPDTTIARATVAPELPLGVPLGELSDAELRRLLSEMGDMEAVTPVESDVIVTPALDRTGA